MKLHQSGPARIGISTAGSRLNADAANLVVLIMYAYNLKSYQVSRTPPLIALGDNFYDISAKAEGEAVPTKAEFRRMLQSLLASRFKLTVHREMREMPVYALAVGKNGPKFKESAPDSSPAVHYGASGRDWEVTMSKATMEGVLNAIENSLLPDRPVLDKTGLTGTYDIKMTYTPNIPPNRQKERDPSDTDIFTAVQRLGLRLEAQKAMIEALVVDHVEQPSGN